VSVEKLEYLNRNASSVQVLSEEADSVVHVVLQDSDRLHVKAATTVIGFGFSKGRDGTIAHVMGAKANGMTRALKRP
jgi:hypothetical protein